MYKHIHVLPLVNIQHSFQCATKLNILGIPCQVLQYAICRSTNNVSFIIRYWPRFAIN